MEGVAGFRDKEPVSHAMLSATSSRNWEGVTAISQQEIGTLPSFPKT